MNLEINPDLILAQLEDHLKTCQHWHTMDDSNYWMRKEIDFQWEWISHEEWKDGEIGTICCDHVDCDWKYQFKITYQYEEVKE